VHNTNLSEYYDTIQAAIDNAKDGENFILVNPGIYNENLIFEDENITIKSTSGAEVTIINAEPTSSALIFAGLVDTLTTQIIDGFTIKNGNAENGGGIYCENSKIILKNLIISNNNASNYGGGIYCYNSANLTIENSVIDANNSSNHGGGIYSGYNSEINLLYSQITNNVASNNGGGIYMNNSEFNLTNTTVADNYALSGGGIFQSGVVNSNLLISNTIVALNEPDNLLNFNDAGLLNVTFSNVEGYVDESNINDNPLFTDGYYLQPNSPCIDSGNPDSPNDPDGTIADIGAYYFDQNANPITLTTRFYANQQLGYQITDEFQFNDISIGENSITSWEWNFGDGNSSSEQNPIHIYQEAGTYSVSLTITDENGATDLLMRNDYLEINAIDFPLTYNTNLCKYYSTIQTAIDDANAENQLLVYPGTYIENINFNGKNVIVQSTDGPELTIIDGNSNGTVVSFVSGEDSTAVFDGFTITNGYNQYGGGICCENYSNPTLRNLIVSNNTAYLNDGGGIYCYFQSSPTIENVIIKGNVAQYRGAALFCEAYSNAILKNVTIYGNTAMYGSTIYAYYNSDIEIKNCIIWGNDTSFGIDIDESMCDILVEFSDIENGWTNGGEGNINADPLFVDPENDNFELNENSPCIGTGENGENMGAIISW